MAQRKARRSPVAWGKPKVEGSTPSKGLWTFFSQSFMTSMTFNHHSSMNSKTRLILFWDFATKKVGEMAGKAQEKLLFIEMIFARNQIVMIEIFTEIIFHIILRLSMHFAWSPLTKYTLMVFYIIAFLQFSSIIPYSSIEIFLQVEVKISCVWLICLAWT